MNTCIIPTLFRPVQTLGNLVPKFGPYAFAQDLRWRKVRGSCLECGLFIIFGAVIFFQKNYDRKIFNSLDCNFSICTDFLYPWWSLKIKKEQKRLSPSSLNSFYHFFVYLVQRIEFQYSIYLLSANPTKWSNTIKTIFFKKVWNQKVLRTSLCSCNNQAIMLYQLHNEVNSSLKKLFLSITDITLMHNCLLP